ncbi:T9SS type A sorting domain-containing protein, partial [Lactobacillus taiwanensis]|uniref:T9SS type A sorting domain-containing protein n=1 Tax=Lactobacillus taiwanensis TaxID=508451 RepID=UPI002731C04A
KFEVEIIQKHLTVQMYDVDIETINQTGLYPGGRGICYNCEQAMVINCYPTPDHAGYPLQVCMSDESVILNRDKTLQDIEVSLGEDFKLSCRLRNVSHDKTRISFGWWLMKDGDPVTQLSNNSYTLRAGYTFTEPVHIRMHLPSELADGSYELRLYSKSPLAPDWREVWENAPSVVSVLVENGFCRITVPDHHSGDPNLMLADSIEELESDYNKQNRDHIYRVHIVNGTTNNFEDIVRIEVSTDQGDMKYDTVLPIYSQTDTEFHINVPDHIFDLEGKTVQALRAYYYDKDSDAFHEITKDGHLAASLLLTDDTAAVRVYSMNGVLMYESSGSCVSEEYGQFLRTLPKGIYIVKEGKKVRKIAI